MSRFAFIAQPGSRRNSITLVHIGTFKRLLDEFLPNFSEICPFNCVTAPVGSASIPQSLNYPNCPTSLNMKAFKSQCIMEKIAAKLQDHFRQIQSELVSNLSLQ
jgi:hypothetical protein